MDGADRPLVIIGGVAEGLGESLAGAFAAAGYDVVGVARSDQAAAAITRRVADNGGVYRALTGDVARPETLAELEPYTERASVLIHNAHRLVIKGFQETSLEDFEETWRVACLGAANLARMVLPQMVARGSGVILFTGATAAIRGADKFAAFASAKFALRGLAQSLAREFGPKGVHVAHPVLDGLLDAPQSDRRFGPARDARMDPDAVAQVYLDVTRQPPSAWTHELDLRPAVERF